MSWDDVIKIVLSALASVGGISGLIIIAIKFSSNIIAKRLEEKYSLKLNKELESYKLLLEKNKYISKVRFDKEFQMYQDLSEKNLSMVYCVGETVAVVRGMFDTKEELANHLEKYCNCLNEAEFTTKKYASFIDEKLFDKYQNLQKQAITIFKLYKFWLANNDVILRIGEEKFTLKMVKGEIENKQKALSDLSDSIIKDVRLYLNCLAITDDENN